MTSHLSRRDLLKSGAALGALAAAGISPMPLAAETPASAKARPASAKAPVYFSREISAAALKRLYAKINQNLSGKLAVKLHTGEPNGPNILSREMVKEFLATLKNPTIVECNVLYPGPRQTTEGHLQTLKTNGWTFCPVDIMDAEGDTPLPIPGGKQLREVAVGKHLLDYDSLLVLTHFKGHTMGGFGGSLKNISIGCASGKLGKAQIHREGNDPWAGGPRFMERIVEGGKAITHHFGTRIAYLNVMNRMSVDCDCAGASAAPPTTPDIGILASTDLLAIDQAAIDLIYALPEDQRKDMVERIESRGGLRQLSYMKAQGMGSDQYELIEI